MDALAQIGPASYWSRSSRLLWLPQGFRRIRLVAYGARLESALGASPRGFESPILRERPSTSEGLLTLNLFVQLVLTARMALRLKLNR